jgi:hypothetical protein
VLPIAQQLHDAREAYAESLRLSAGLEIPPLLAAGDFTEEPEPLPPAARPDARSGARPGPSKLKASSSGPGPSMQPRPELAAPARSDPRVDAVLLPLRVGSSFRHNDPAMSLRLTAFLSDAKLTHHEERLRAEGYCAHVISYCEPTSLHVACVFRYEEVDDFADADENDLMLIGLKKPEVKRLRRYLEQLAGIGAADPGM